MGAVLGVVIATTLAGRRVHRWLLAAATVACIVLLLRGALGLTLLGGSVLSGTFDEQVPLVLLAIEPWFVLGGLAFGGMVISQRKKPADVGPLVPLSAPLLGLRCGSSRADGGREQFIDRGLTLCVRALRSGRTHLYRRQARSCRWRAQPGLPSGRGMTRAPACRGLRLALSRP